MSLEEALAQRRKLVSETMPGDDLRGISDEIERLRMLQVAETCMQVGEVLPDFALPDTSGRLHASDEMLPRGPLVLIFFRGAWCPYCDVAFGEVEKARPEIEQAGGLVVGVCPDRAEVLHQSAEVERGARYLLLTDPDGAFARLCGLRWQVSAEHAEFLKRINVDLPERHGAAEWTLPIPASFVVDRDGIVRYAFADADWGRRATPEAILAVLRELAQPSP
jgi:peroxiredoxin